MKKITMLLSAVALAITISSCTKSVSVSEMKIETTEQFQEKFSEYHKKGIDDIMGLVYQKEQVPANVMEMSKKMLKDCMEKEIKEITFKKFNATNYDKQIAAMKKRGMKMPSKPTDQVTIAFEGKSNEKISLPIGKIDGSYFLIMPIEIAK